MNRCGMPVNYSNYYESSYGMRNRTAISSLYRQLGRISIFLTIMAAGMATANAGASQLSQACKPYVSEATDGIPEPDYPVPFGQGVFWRIEKDGKTNYILGTMHSQDRRVTTLSPQQRLRLARSQRLLIEVVPGAEANRTYRDAMYEQDGRSLHEDLPPALYDRLATIARQYGLPGDKLNQLEPWAAFSQIGRPKPVNGPTQDGVIHNTAVGMGLEVIGLESMAELVDTLASLPYEDQITILKDTICNHARIVRESKTLLDLYLAGDLAGMVAFNNQPHYDEAIFERFMDTVLTQRNKRMFERIQPYLEKGGSFIALGALHLPDEDGLLTMMAEAGYKLSRNETN